MMGSPIVPIALTASLKVSRLCARVYDEASRQRIGKAWYNARIHISVCGSLSDVPVLCAFRRQVRFGNDLLNFVPLKLARFESLYRLLQVDSVKSVYHLCVSFCWVHSFVGCTTQKFCRNVGVKGGAYARSIDCCILSVTIL